MKKLFLISLLISSSVFAKSALIIVDMQNCFVAGEDKSIHSLAVKDASDLVPLINKIQSKFDLVVATKDWHPANHVSFASSHINAKPFTSTQLENGQTQALWPDHCVQNTKGSDFVSGLNTKNISKVIYKGQDTHVDSYSGFMDNNKNDMTQMHKYLKKQNITELYVVGLAADYCVKFTAIDGAQLGYKTYFVRDLTKAVDPSDLSKLYKSLSKNSVKIISSKEI